MSKSRTRRNLPPVADEPGSGLPVPAEGADRIEIRGLEFLSYCGVLAEEQARKQPFRLDVDLYTDLSQAGQTDDLANTVDYGAVTDRLLDQLSSERHQLVERLAQRAMELVFENSLVMAATVRVRKLRPPIAAQVETTGVRIHRTNPTDARP